MQNALIAQTKSPKQIRKFHEEYPDFPKPSLPGRIP